MSSLRRGVMLVRLGSNCFCWRCVWDKGC